MHPSLRRHLFPLLTVRAAAARSAAGFVAPSPLRRQQPRPFASATAPPRAGAFAELGVAQSLDRALELAGFDEPTEVQRLALPLLTMDPEEPDVVVAAETGCGKTLTYLLPLLQRHGPGVDADAGAGAGADTDADTAEAAPGRRFPAALVLVPTRELCQQVVRMAAQLLPEGVEADDVIRAHQGTSSSWPYHARRGCPPILVATPTFVWTHRREDKLFGTCGELVVDEADMLLDGGFRRDLDEILAAFRRADRIAKAAAVAAPSLMGEGAAKPKPTRFVMVAATLPSYGLKSVEAYLQWKFPDAVRVSQSGLHRHLSTIDQSFDNVGETLDEKLRALGGVLYPAGLAAAAAAGVPMPRTMVFSNTAAAAQRCFETLRDNYPGVRAAAFHKKVHPDARTEVLEQFRAGEVDVLCCTDLAARGLDVAGVDRVVQLEFASNVVQHLHRVGRASRAGASGTAVNFFAKGDVDLVERIRGAGEASLEESFSRRRGFRKKIKKAERQERERFAPDALREEFGESDAPGGGGGGGGDELARAFLGDFEAGEEVGGKGSDGGGDDAGEVARAFLGDFEAGVQDGGDQGGDGDGRY